jgi:two-component system response regulator DctR
MPGMSGLALFERLTERGLAAVIPVIFLTGHADLPTAVDDGQARRVRLLRESRYPTTRWSTGWRRPSCVRPQQLELRGRKASVTRRLAELTERERDVMRLVVEGLPNKLVADQLDISVRTVEVHRARVFDKMDVKSAVELARLLQQL